MRVFLILLGKELRSFFLSPIAYVVVALVMILNGLSFVFAIDRLLDGSAYSIVHWTFKAPWFYLFYFIVFPLITMKLFAEEQKLGTMETLLTAPVSANQLVLSKYFAAVIFYAVLWLPSVVNFFVLNWITHGQIEIPSGSLMGSYAILVLMGLLNIAIGCFASSMTKSQIIAAIVCYALVLAHYLLGFFMLLYVRELPEQFVGFVTYFASTSHIEKFTAGQISTQPIVYYTSFAIFFLALTHQVVEFRRWKV